MTRLGLLFWVILVLGTGFTTFKVKYAVQDIEDELTRVRKQTLAEQQEIRVLNAEWTYLNQPERLAELNRKFLNLAPVAAKQLQQRIADLPLRSPPPPPVPDPPVAADDATDQPPAKDEPASAAIAVATTTPAVAPPAADSPGEMPGSLDALIAANLDPEQSLPLDTSDQPPTAPPASIATGRKAAAPAFRALAALAIAPAAAASHPAAAKTAAPARPGSLDALIAQIAETR